MASAHGASSANINTANNPHNSYGYINSITDTAVGAIAMRMNGTMVMESLNPIVNKFLKAPPEDTHGVTGNFGRTHPCMNKCCAPEYIVTEFTVLIYIFILSGFKK
ncbi:hypothetical protein B5X24_HaOG202786 [Helicoverpa armigera]|uniref:Uncharacterized protein n=1 Tax=Helicoverpa armigera TaxID=29058 RepID=A0A2W1BW82_HELAM|nr:hypothetical protein B5X24_HaOG202786 [Helicoverpa armigera]